MQTALDWQTMKVNDTAETINDYVYIGPHKWIVCLIGSNGCVPNTFMSSNESILNNMPNLSISVMCLSEAPVEKRLADGFEQMAMATSEGVFFNMTDIYRKEENASAFFGSMGVYPSDNEFGQLYVKENFSIL